jgi:SM-20-related protein
LHETIRKTTSVEISADTISMVHERLLAERTALAEHFGLELHDCESPQFLLYRPGDFFVCHQDGDSEQVEFDHLRVRKISIVVFLNQAGEQTEPDTYGGGSLVFYCEPDLQGNFQTTRELIGETGLLVGFAAHTTHEVIPVVHGERFSIVSWFK